MKSLQSAAKILVHSDHSVSPQPPATLHPEKAKNIFRYIARFME
jgi:hypothetical protein